MKLKDLARFVCDEVRLYEEGYENFDYLAPEYKELYTGRLMSAPGELLEREVRVISAKRKNLLDIELMK